MKTVIRSRRTIDGTIELYDVDTGEIYGGPQTAAERIAFAEKMTDFTFNLGYQLQRQRRSHFPEKAKPEPYLAPNPGSYVPVDDRGLPFLDRTLNPMTAGRIRNTVGKGKFEARRKELFHGQTETKLSESEVWA